MQAGAQGHNSSALNESQSLSLETVYQTYTVIAQLERYVPPVFICLGVPGNALCAFFWLQKQVRSSSAIYLASLGFTQLLFLLLYTVSYIERVHGNTINYPVFCEFFITTFYASQYLHSFLTAAFTLERWFAVTFPFQAHVLCDVRKATIISACLALVALCVGAVQLVFWRFNYANNSCNVQEAVKEKGTFEHMFWSVWTWMVEMTVFALIPLVVLVFNVCVIVTTQRVASKDRKVHGKLAVAHVSKMAEGERRTGNASVTTVTLLCVSFYFICTTLPVAICTSLFFDHPPGDHQMVLEDVPHDPAWRKHLAYHTAKVVIDTTAVSQYCCAFYIYLLTSRMFRLQLCTKLCPDRASNSRSMSVLHERGTSIHLLHSSSHPSNSKPRSNSATGLLTERPITRQQLDARRASAGPNAS